MAEFDDLAQAAIALQDALANLDRIQNNLAASLRKYYKEGNKTVCGIIEKAAKFRRELRAIDRFLGVRRGKLRQPGVFFLALPTLFKLDDAPIAWVRLIRRLADHGIDHAQACDAVERLYRQTREIFMQKQKILQRAFTRRFAKTIDARQANPRLSGKVTVRVQFSSRVGIDEIARARPFPQALDEVVHAIDESGLDAESYFSRMADTVFLAVQYLLSDFPEALTRTLGEPLRAEIIMIILPMKTGGFGLFHTRLRFGKKDLFGVEEHGRRIRVFLTFGMFARQLAKRPPEQVAQNISMSLSHEIAHALDRSFGTMASVFEHIRIEGVAMFTEALRQPPRIINTLQTSHLKIWTSEEELFSDTEKDDELPYTIGLVMCLGILFLHIKKRHNRIYTPLTDKNEIIGALRDPSFKSTILDVHRMIHVMTAKLFFRTYQRAVAEGVAPRLFSDELIRSVE